MYWVGYVLSMEIIKYSLQREEYSTKEELCMKDGLQCMYTRCGYTHYYFGFSMRFINHI